ncbi:MAG: hypothetical protein LUD27_06030 [Clostridia bacterium]|nr:hypothetical protein [Clostridia bacterium]
MNKLTCFTAVEFPDDPNVAGICYWYACPFEDAEVGDNVIAPLGRHNNTQKGVIREVRWTDEFDAPFPMYMIKYVRQLIKEQKEL